ncbi:hypothetical protein IWZ01DRAFT_89150 [Phyllosticta capitalensis]
MARPLRDKRRYIPKWFDHDGLGSQPRRQRMSAFLSRVWGLFIQQPCAKEDLPGLTRAAGVGSQLEASTTRAESAFASPRERSQESNEPHGGHGDSTRHQHYAKKRVVQSPTTHISTVRGAHSGQSWGLSSLPASSQTLQRSRSETFNNERETTHRSQLSDYPSSPSPVYVNPYRKSSNDPLPIPSSTCEPRSSQKSFDSSPSSSAIYGYPSSQESVDPPIFPSPLFSSKESADDPPSSQASTAPPSIQEPDDTPQATVDIQLRKRVMLNKRPAAAQERLRRGANNVLEAFQGMSFEPDQCWLHPRPDKKGRVIISVNFQDWESFSTRASQSVSFEFGMALKLLNGTMSHEEQEGWVRESWHLSHLCGNASCCNHEHHVVEPGTVNFSRKNCHNRRDNIAGAAYRSCSHSPPCFYRTKDGLPYKPKSVKGKPFEKKVLHQTSLTFKSTKRPATSPPSTAKRQLSPSPKYRQGTLYPTSTPDTPRPSSNIDNGPSMTTSLGTKRKATELLEDSKESEDNHNKWFKRSLSHNRS